MSFTCLLFFFFELDQFKTNPRFCLKLVAVQVIELWCFCNFFFLYLFKEFFIVPSSDHHQDEKTKRHLCEKFRVLKLCFDTNLVIFWLGHDGFELIPKGVALHATSKWWKSNGAQNFQGSQNLVQNPISAESFFTR